MAVNLRYLFQIQFTGKHHHICKLCIKLQSLHVRYIQLSRKVYLLTDLTGITHHRHISSNHGRNTGLFCRIHNGTHQLQIGIVDDCIYRQIALHSMFVAGTGYLSQVVNRKSIGRTGTHVQIGNTKINGIGTRLDSCRKRLAGTYRSHYLKVSYIHNLRLKIDLS